MSRRTLLPGLLLGAALAGGASALAASNEQPPAAPEPGQQPATKSITLIGVVEVDETTVARTHARVKGRIDKLHVRLTGQKVKRGEPLADLYSPDLVVAGQNLLDARRSGNRELERTARDRLQLWGMDKDQIEDILKTGKLVSRLTVRSPISGHVIKKYQVEGEYVEEGARLFDVADLSAVWVEAKVEDEAVLASLRGRLPVRVTTKAFPDRKFSGELLLLFPGGNTLTELKMRFAVKNPRQELLPGMHATVLLDVPAGSSETKDAKLKELLKERLTAARAVVKVATAEYQTGKVTFERLHQAMQALLRAQLELCESDKEQIAVLEEAVALAKEYEKMAAERYKAAAASHSDALMATASRLEAEIALERAKSKVPAQPK